MEIQMQRADLISFWSKRLEYVTFLTKHSHAYFILSHVQICLLDISVTFLNLLREIEVSDSKQTEKIKYMLLDLKFCSLSRCIDIKNSVKIFYKKPHVL